MQRVSEAAALTLKRMREYVQPGMSTQELDDFGGKILEEYGARSAPMLAYQFPGRTCISINEEIAHGIPSINRIVQEGDLINIDVSAELDGYWSDNGGSFVVGADLHHHQPLIDASKRILKRAISQIKGGVRISDIGRLISNDARIAGFRVIKNLAGHGVGSSLHEDPEEIPNFNDRSNLGRFRKNTVIAVETFISTHSTMANTLADGWTMVGNRGGFVAQHEHTLVVTDGAPLILTLANDIWTE